MVSVMWAKGNGQEAAVETDGNEEQQQRQAGDDLGMTSGAETMPKTAPTPEARVRVKVSAANVPSTVATVAGYDTDARALPRWRP